jgi:hypothetical protein
MRILQDQTLALANITVMPEEDVDPLLRRHTMVDPFQTTFEVKKGKCKLPCK